MFVFRIATTALVAALLLATPLASFAAPAAGSQYTAGGGTGDTGTGEDGTGGASGPLAGEPVTVDSTDADDAFDPGDTATIACNCSVADGASITLEDGDGTQGTFTDDVNAVITEGSVVIKPTAAASNTSGGNGELNESGLSVLATNGIEVLAAAGSGAGVLPRTGANYLYLLGGLCLVLLCAFGLRRMTRASRAS